MWYLSIRGSIACYFWKQDEDIYTQTLISWSFVPLFFRLQRGMFGYLLHYNYSHSSFSLASSMKWFIIVNGEIEVLGSQHKRTIFFSLRKMHVRLYNSAPLPVKRLHCQVWYWFFLHNPNLLEIIVMN